MVATVGSMAARREEIGKAKDGATGDGEEEDAAAVVGGEGDLGGGAGGGWAVWRRCGAV